MEQELYHHGIEGQRWGDRNGPPYPLSSSDYSSAERQHMRTKTNSGVEINMNKQPASKVATALSKVSKKIRDNVEKTSSFDISKDGEKIGELDLFEESPQELNVMWVTVSSKEENQGYGTAVMNAVVDYGKQFGYDKITLEVPGESPNAKHIYEKLGFKDVGTLTDDDDVWGGLTKMELELKKKDKYLQHHGIIGQRWGVRRYQNYDGSLTSAGKKRLEKKDAKWANKNADKITQKAQKKVSKPLAKYSNELTSNPNAWTKSGKLSAQTVNAYNQKMASLMNEQVSDLRSPSGKCVKFVAKRGEVGVMMALADEGYNMDQLKNGVWTSGKVAYKKKMLNKM